MIPPQEKSWTASSAKRRNGDKTMDARCDLHTHSLYSDGTNTPAELLTLAEEAGLSALVLCDHNTVAGLPHFLEAAQNSSVEAVPGIEFSTDYQGIELHILGLFIQEQHYDAVNALLEEALARKEQSNLEMITRMQKQGFPFDYWAIKAESSGANMNRAVISAYMVRHGFCSTMNEAFDQWLNQGCGFYVPPERPDAIETIRFIKSIGAVAVLAHPLLSIEEVLLRQFLEDAKELDGIEVYYSKYNETQTALAAELAEEFGLVKSGGSDFHGNNKPDIHIGVGRGNLSIPLSCLDELKKRR